MSLLEERHTSYTWTVSNYKSLLTANPQIKSSNFAMSVNPRIEWCLVLNFFDTGAGNCNCCNYRGGPCYQNQSGQRILSLYLENCKADEEDVSFNVAFSIILPDTNDKVFTRNTTISGKIVNTEKYGFYRFIPETEVRDSFNILCEIKTIDEADSGNLPFLKGFDSFMNNQTFSDFVLFIDQEKVYVHKLILSSKSPVFHKMFLTDMKESNSNEAKVKDIKFEVFNELLRYMYTGKVEKLDELGLDIFKAAHFYEISDLMLICEHALKKSLKIENSIDLLILADDHNANCLKEHCVAFILKNFKAIMKTAAFKDLNKSHPHLPFELLIEIGSLFFK